MVIMDKDLNGGNVGHGSAPLTPPASSMSQTMSDLDDFGKPIAAKVAAEEAAKDINAEIEAIHNNGFDAKKSSKPVSQIDADPLNKVDLSEESDASDATDTKVSSDFDPEIVPTNEKVTDEPYDFSKNSNNTTSFHDLGHNAQSEEPKPTQPSKSDNEDGNDLASSWKNFRKSHHGTEATETVAEGKTVHVEEKPAHVDEEEPAPVHVQTTVPTSEPVAEPKSSDNVPTDAKDEISTEATDESQVVADDEPKDAHVPTPIISAVSDDEEDPAKKKAALEKLSSLAVAPVDEPKKETEEDKTLLEKVGLAESNEKDRLNVLALVINSIGYLSYLIVTICFAVSLINKPLFNLGGNYNNPTVFLWIASFCLLSILNMAVVISVQSVNLPTKLSNVHILPGVGTILLGLFSLQAAMMTLAGEGASSVALLFIGVALSLIVPILMLFLMKSFNRVILTIIQVFSWLQILAPVCLTFIVSMILFGLAG